MTSLSEWFHRLMPNRFRVYDVPSVGIVRLMREQQVRGEWEPTHVFPEKREPVSLREMVEKKS